MINASALKPLAITMGDPSGVGPEICLKAIASLPIGDRRNFVIIGDQRTLERARNACGLDITFQPESGDYCKIIHVPVDGLPDQFGVLSPRCGEAAFRYLEKAVELAISGEVSAIVTAPINKEALNLAGHHFDGHTGMLAHLTNSTSSWMLLASERLNVIHVSTHVALKEAIDRATPDRVYKTIRMGYDHLRRLGTHNPRIAVAGINPHCGESGLFGNEDDLQVAPGVAMARAEGINVAGPISADTVYYKAYQGAFDLVVAQYHDQGHIPIKLVAFDTAVNVTLGLPIDRVSVDHGTAFDIAGKGVANHVNMLSAIAYASKLR